MLGNFIFYKHCTYTKMSFRYTSNSSRSHGIASFLQLDVLEYACTEWLHMEPDPVPSGQYCPV